jgi:hypothetical protein
VPVDERARTNRHCGFDVLVNHQSENRLATLREHVFLPLALSQ